MLISWSRVNGYLGDPAVFSFFPRSGEAILLDLGSLEALSHRDLLRVRLCLVSHTHIDHFIGFDRLLRVNIPHRRELEVVGPTGILENIRGKLQGYLWNLLDNDQLRLIVREIDRSGHVTSFYLRNQNCFRPEIMGNHPKVGSSHYGSLITTLKDGCEIYGAVLDHATDVVAYVIQSPLRFKTDQEEIKALGLSPGPWIRDLQTAAISNAFDQSLIIDGISYQVSDLATKLLKTYQPKLLGYVTDIGFTARNLERLIPLIEDAETLICEANFSDSDFRKARLKMHLTTRQAALLSARARVKSLEIFHISNLYAKDPTPHLEEAAAFFKFYQTLSSESLKQECANEIARAT